MKRAASVCALVAGLASSSATADPCHAIAIGEVGAPVDALAVSHSAIYGVSSVRGEVVRILLDGHEPPLVIAKAEHEPFAIAVRGDQPVWASRDGVFGSDANGAHRRLLVQGAVSAITAAPNGLYVATGETILRSDWPTPGDATLVVGHVFASELVAGASWIAWISGDTVESYRPALRERRVLARDQRRPHDLSTFGDALLWHEGEADLLPGREPGASLVDLRSGRVEHAAGRYDSANRYLLRAPFVYGAAVCKKLDSAVWRNLDSGEGEPPVTDDDRRWYWVVDLHRERWRIIAADKRSCSCAPKR